MLKLAPRTVNFAAFLLACCALIIALYLEIHVGLAPCPLCVIQRLIFLLLAFLFLLSGLINPLYKAQRYLYGTTFLISLLGILVAGRHIWLQALPASANPPACGASLNYLLHVLPLGEALRMLFAGSGDCAKVTWSWFGITLPEMAMGLFILLGGLSLWQMLRES